MLAIAAFGASAFEKSVGVANGRHKDSIFELHPTNSTTKTETISNLS
jgi:hypothetical protein